MNPVTKTACKIKKVYVGVDGVSRLCYEDSGN